MMRVKQADMGVGNLTFLLDQMGRDAGPTRFVREYTRNSLDAGATQIAWDIIHFPGSPAMAQKLGIIDNGQGMTPEDMVQLLNKLSSSGKTQSKTGNFGVGGKISALLRNPHGIVYMSWKDGKGSMIRIWKDPETEKYGLKELDREGNNVVTVSNTFKPASIGKNGTVVTFLGETDADDTTLPPPGTSLAKTKWVPRELNTRFHFFPEGVTVTTRDARTTPAHQAADGKLRTIFGQAYYLNKYAEASGSVAVRSAKVHWWILKDDENIRAQAHVWQPHGHAAALFQDELYEKKPGQSMLNEFGVVLGGNRVVIYVEPDAQTLGDNLSADTARNNLILDGHPLPWSAWAAEFRDNMPQELNELMDGISPQVGAEDLLAKITSSLAAVDHLFADNIKRARAGFPAERGIGTGHKLGEQGPTNETGTGTPNNNGNGKPHKTGGAVDLLAAFAKTITMPNAKRRKDFEVPTLRYFSEHDGNIPNDMKGVSARYHPASNELHINTGFDSFERIVESEFVKRGRRSGIRKVIQETVRVHATIQLIHGLRGYLSTHSQQEGVDNGRYFTALAASIVGTIESKVGQALNRQLARPTKEPVQPQHENGRAGTAAQPQPSA
jgi:hypothetical protein